MDKFRYWRFCCRRTDNDNSRFLPMGVWTWIVLSKNHNAWIIDLLMRRVLHLSVLPLKNVVFC
jgi:hypothetical protein